MRSSPIPGGMGEESRNKEMRGEWVTQAWGKIIAYKFKDHCGFTVNSRRKESSKQQKSNVREIWYL